MINLSINVNKIATLRNSRGGRRPAVGPFAESAIRCGVQGITVHPRPDERHVTYRDVFDLREVVTTVEYNIEGYPDHRYRGIIRDAKPTQATLVPDGPDVLTSCAGWDAVAHKDFLRDIIAELQSHGARVSLFMETDLAQLDAAREAGADRIEFYTEPYAAAFLEGRGQQSFDKFAAAARHANNIGLGINAGHDLDLDNMVLFRDLPGLLEVSIGHAVVCDALLYGWEETIRRYLAVVRPGAEGDAPA